MYTVDRPKKDLEKITSVFFTICVCNAILHVVAFTCHAPTLADEINGQAVKHYNVLDRENGRKLLGPVSSKLSKHDLYFLDLRQSGQPLGLQTRKLKCVKKGNSCEIAKGQLISKCLFGIFNSPKEGMKKFNFTTNYGTSSRIVFVRVMGVLKTPK